MESIESTEEKSNVIELKKPERNLALIDLDAFAKGNKKNFEVYMQVVNRLPALLRKAVMKAYADGIDDTCKLLDKVKSK